MKISVKQTGGFAGLSEEIAAIDTAELDAAATQQVEQMVQETGFFDLPPDMRTEIGADLELYEVTVTEGDRQHTVTFNKDGKEDESPQVARLRRLVATLL